MSLAVQIMMGVSLAACAGLRAWLPVLAVGLLGRAGFLPLEPRFMFLTHVNTLTVVAIAAALEMLGDKFITLDHALDAFGTLARPAAGAVLATSTMTHANPDMAALIGVALGGGTALTLHAGKAAARVHSTALAPFHAGAGNMALSIGEDAVAVFGIAAAALAPVFSFCIVVAALCVSVWMVTIAIRHGARLMSFLRRSPAR